MRGTLTYLAALLTLFLQDEMQVKRRALGRATVDAHTGRRRA